MDDLAERLRSLAVSFDGDQWDHPITAKQDVERALRVIEYLEDPKVLLTIPPPHRRKLSELLHGKDVRL